MRSVLTKYVRSKGKTLKYEFAVAAFAVWIAASVRIFLSGDPVWIAAQATNYGTLTSAVWLFIAAAVGIQAWQNTRSSSEQPGTATTVSTEPAYETGDLPSPDSPEDIARRVG